MKKTSFYIRTTQGVCKVEGYKEPFIDYAGRDFYVGVFKADKGQWHVSCLLTGFMLNEAATKKDAIAKFHEIYESKYNKLLSHEHESNSYIAKMSAEYQNMIESYERRERKEEQ